MLVPTALFEAAWRLLWGKDYDRDKDPPRTAKGKGSTLEICNKCRVAVHDPTSARNHCSLAPAALPQQPDPDTVLPLLPRNARFSMRNLTPVYRDTITNKILYGLLRQWREDR